MFVSRPVAEAKPVSPPPSNSCAKRGWLVSSRGWPVPKAEACCRWSRRCLWAPGVMSTSHRADEDRRAQSRPPAGLPVNKSLVFVSSAEEARLNREFHRNGPTMAGACRHRDGHVRRPESRRAIFFARRQALRVSRLTPGVSAPPGKSVAVRVVSMIGRRRTGTTDLGAPTVGAVVAADPVLRSPLNVPAVEPGVAPSRLSKSLHRTAGVESRAARPKVDAKPHAPESPGTDRAQEEAPAHRPTDISRRNR